MHENKRRTSHQIQRAEKKTPPVEAFMNLVDNLRFLTDPPPANKKLASEWRECPGPHDGPVRNLNEINCI